MRHLREIFKSGLITLIPLALAGWVIYSFLKINNAIWSVVPFPEKLVDYRWLVNLSMSVLIVLLIGLVVKLLHPVKRILKIFPFLTFLKINDHEKNSSEWPVVRVEWGGAKFLGWLDEIRVNEKGEKEYKVTVPSAPLPISAQILFVPSDKIEFTNLTTPDYLRQLGSLGFRKLPEGIHFFRPEDNRAPM